MLVSAAKLLSKLIETSHLLENDGKMVLVEFPASLLEELAVWGDKIEDLEPEDAFGDAVEFEAQHLYSMAS